MRWFGLLAIALFLGCADSMDTAPNANSNTTDSSGTITTNKPVTDESGTLSPANQPADEATRRDNTAVNSRDTESSAKTPLDQGNDSRDVSVTADIRKAIVDKDNMSINARNVKIITENGHVTLRGPVDSQAEKDAIEKIAKDRAGADKVDNHLEIASDKTVPMDPAPKIDSVPQTEPSPEPSPEPATDPAPDKTPASVPE